MSFLNRSHGNKQAFLMDICRNITSHGDLHDIAISLGIELPKVDAQATNWPRNIMQVSLMCGLD